MNLYQLLLKNQEHYHYQFQDKAQLTDVWSDKSGCTRIKITSPKWPLKDKGATVNYFQPLWILSKVRSLIQLSCKTVMTKVICYEKSNNSDTGARLLKRTGLIVICAFNGRTENAVLPWILLLGMSDEKWALGWSIKCNWIAFLYILINLFF